MLATFALVAVLSVFAAASAAAQPDPSAAALCSEHHGFGAQPVDIAKTADRTRVLARVQWGYSAPGGFCYLVLDDAAVDTLRANALQLPDPSPVNADPQAAARCSQHHGFGAQPVDVAKTADRTRVLAQVQWGYSAPGGFCYLTLNPAATQTLRNTDDTDSDDADDTDDDTDDTDDDATDETDSGDDTDDDTDATQTLRNPCNTDNETDDEDDTPTTPKELPAEALQAAETSVEVRVTACWRSDGRIEFALQQRQPDDTWGQHLFVQRRMLRPETVESGTGSWKYSTLFELEGGVTVRIAARWYSDGRVEFALQQRQPDDTWGQHLFVRQRLLQPETIESGTGSWDYSTPYLLIALTVEDPAPRIEGDSFTIPEGPRGDDTLITVGQGRTCAVRVDGGATCWGLNGLLDHVVLAEHKDIVAITTSNHWGSNLHACILHEDGTISCWGDGQHGKLGQDDKSSHYIPMKVPRINDAVAVSAGGEFTCALHRDGGVSCWGRNNHGQMVDGTKKDRFSPRRIPGLSDVVTIASGMNTACAVHRDGDISCWGEPYEISDTGPERFNPPAAFASVSLGPMSASRFCATSVDGDVYCWAPRLNPEAATRVEGLADVVEVSTGIASTCALHRDGGVSCWGQNQAGEVGDGTTSARRGPERIAGISDAVAINVSAGSYLDSSSWRVVNPHACALRADGSALCWGANEVGQLGDGTNQSRLVPTPVQPIAATPADQVPLTPTELLRTWAEAVVQEREARYPWMRVAWDHIQDQTIALQTPRVAGQVIRSCHASAEEFGCEAISMEIGDISPGTLVHELLHVYDLTTGLAPPKAWGAVQLYFATTYPGCYDSGGISGAEILADTVTHLIIPDGLLAYYSKGGCPTLPAYSKPTEEAEEVVLQGMASQVPDWYRENITNGAELWAAWVRGPSMPALANLADEFGGLCSTDWITHPLDPERFPPADSNPFKDGGCDEDDAP